jgi:hypothetical protein
MRALGVSVAVAATLPLLLVLPPGAMCLDGHRHSHRDQRRFG